jgi:hypothetical protein
MSADESNWKPDYSVTPRRVVCAANRHKTKGIVVCGVRHWDKLMRGQVDAMGEKPIGWDQGFVDQFGDWKIATDQNQIVREVSSPGTLYSENLY